jgi:hypothetical protein
MRKFIGLAVMAAFVWVAAAPAEAVVIAKGEDAAKLTDVSSFFVDTDADGVADTPLAQVPGPGLGGLNANNLVGSELRGIFRITGLYDNWEKSGDPYYEDSDPGELTGLLYDLVVVDVVQSAPGASFELYLAGGGRYAAGSGVANAGGRLDVWFDDPEDYAIGVANNWTEGTDPGNDSYPGASDGSLWLRANFVPYPTLTPNTNVPFVYFVSISSSSRTGQGRGYADVVVNNTGTPIAGNVDFEDGVSPVNGGDLSVLTNLTLNAVGSTTWSDWQTRSEDPVLFLGIPEPASMSLLLVGLFGGAGAYWKRRRAA